MTEHIVKEREHLSRDKVKLTLQVRYVTPLKDEI